VSAFKVQGTDKRFEEVPEMVSGVLRFSGNRLATFTSSFGAAATDSYRVVGTKGELRLEPAYDYHEPLECYLTVRREDR
jgi:predicted dehydrogenase